jgi:phosphatidylglycerol lysyltransferase
MAAPTPHRAMTLAIRYRVALTAVAILAVTGLALAALHGLLSHVRLHDVGAALRGLQPGRIAAALLMTAGSYLALTFYDVVALRVVGRRLPYRTAALASFTSYTLSHNLGLSLLTGGSARYRVYSAAGLSAGDIGRIIANATLTFWSGIILVSGIALIALPGLIEFAGFEAGTAVQRAIGGLLLLAIAGRLILAGRVKRIAVLSWSLPLPDRKTALTQLLIATADIAMAGGALFALIPGIGPEFFPAFFVGYALAIVIAAISHAPGGIGVFEAVILLALPQVDTAALAAALLAYRAIYYFAPLIVAAAIMAISEGRRFRAPLRRALADAQPAGDSVAPIFISALVFVGGVVLLVSGSLPAIPARLHAIYNFVPLPFIEASHILASLVGTLLLFLAPGLYRRLDGAFVATRMLLLAGAIFSLLKGIDFEEAAILLAILGLLQWSRKAFYRRTRFTAGDFSGDWVAVSGASIAVAIWIGFFAYKHVAYDHELWWDFALKGDASRFLRASFAATVLAISLLLRHMLAPARRIERTELSAAVADRALAAVNRADAMLAFTGDKRFLIDGNGDAFLSYQVQGRSWIAMGDPVGDRAAWPDLMWRLREQADAQQGRVLFYQLSTEALPIAIDLGLTLIKYGEEARVPLATFSLAGHEAKSFRSAERRAQREGANFEIVPAGQVPALLPELQSVSNAWLAQKGRSEKAFSLGRFDPAYLSRFDCAVIRQAGAIVAFANIWATPNRIELSVDLMRHVAGLPYSAMDYLFPQLMLWGRAQRYQCFSLGLAPLSGLDHRRLAPLWAHAGNLVYRHGEGLYGFEGLRFYKEKFSPLWQPRYIAARGHVALARGLIDLNSLISGGRASAARSAVNSDALPQGVLFKRGQAEADPDHFASDHYDQERGGPRQSRPKAGLQLPGFRHKAY